MASYAFDVYPANDPAGKISTTLSAARLVRLTVDGQLVSGWYKHVGHGLGEGQIQIHTDQADATEANIAKRNYVMFVRTDTDPEQQIGGFFLEDGDFTALSRQERGGRILTYGGPGGMFILDRYVLGHSVYADGQSNRGDFNIEGQWTWSQEPYGAMLLRAIEEGQDHPSAFFEAVGVDFTRVRDSNNLLWDELNDYETPIGTSVLELYSDFLRLGLVAQISGELTISAYRDIEEFRTDRTSATFAAGKARFEAGVNILNDMPRRLAPSQERTHVLIRDRVGDYETIDEDLDLNPIGGVPYMTFLKSDTTADDDAIRKMGRLHLTRRKQYSDQATVRHIIGSGTGEYAPGPEGDYWVLDLVTLHTGSGQHDFDETPIEVSSIRYYHDDAGNWFAETELGAQYIPPQAERFQRQITSAIRNAPGVQLCQPYTQLEVPDLTIVGSKGVSQSTGSTLSTTLTGIGDWQAGDLCIVHAASHLTSDIPIPPSGWTGIGSGGGAGLPVTLSQRGAYRILQESDLSTGEWQNVTSLIVMVFRGADTTDPIGSIAGSGASSSPMTWPSMSAFDNTDGTSWVLLIGHHDDGEIDSGTPSGGGTLLESTRGAGDHAVWYRADQSSFGGATMTVIDNDWQTTSYEIKVDPNVTIVAGDAHADLVGTSVKATRCDHAHHVFRDTAPTVNDDSADGYPVGTLWIRVNSLTSPTSVTSRHRLLDNAEGAAVWVTESGGSGAPTDANYLVGTANGSLSNEIVVGTSPGGELGGTWASPTVDATHSGSTHAAAQAAAEATAAAALAAHGADADAHHPAAVASRWEVLLTEDGSEPITTEDGLDWLYVEVFD